VVVISLSDMNRLETRGASKRPPRQLLPTFRKERHTPIILGEPGDQPLLGIITLERDIVDSCVLRF
jgi:hypothetical protein